MLQNKSLIIEKKYVLYLMDICLNIYKCTICVPGASGGQNGTLDHLVLGL